jgi:hypothetical protein
VTCEVRAMWLIQVQEMFHVPAVSGSAMSVSGTSCMDRKYSGRLDMSVAAPTHILDHRHLGGGGVTGEGKLRYHIDNSA